MERVTPFAISVASLIGREHVRLHRNNQDAAAVRTRGDVLAAVVADGCGEGARSEVGATLGAEFLAGWLAENAADALDEEDLRRGGESACLACRPDVAQDFAEEACATLLAYLRPLVPKEPVSVWEGVEARGPGRGEQGGQTSDAQPFGPSRTHARGSGQPLDAAFFVHQHLLFTLLCAVVTPTRTIVFGIGDGAYAINGEARVLASGPDNAPAYLGYRLVPAHLLTGDAAATTPPVVHHDGPTRSVHSLLICTDGFPLDAQLDREDAFAKNPTLLQRRLCVLGERERRMFDDATCVLLQRRTEA